MTEKKCVGNCVVPENTHFWFEPPGPQFWFKFSLISLSSEVNFLNY